MQIGDVLVHVAFGPALTQESWHEPNKKNHAGFSKIYLSMHVCDTGLSQPQFKKRRKDVTIECQNHVNDYNHCIQYFFK